MFYYSAFGLIIASELELPRLIPAQGPDADVHIRIDRIDKNGLEAPRLIKPFCQMADNSLWLQIPGIARFLVVNGTRISVEPEADADPQSVRLYLLGSCIGALMHQRNRLIIHGTAVRFGDQCAIFAGNSGLGKSTLAAAFHQSGYEILADDLAVIDKQQRVVPGYPQIKLWHDAIVKLGIDTSRLQRIRRQINKYAVPLTTGFCHTPLPIRTIYILQSHNQKQYLFKPVEGFSKFQPLKNQTYRGGYLEGLGLQEQHLKICAQLAGRIRLVRLTRPDHGFDLDRLVELILNDLNDNEAAA